jgi:hypothetical protein
MISISRSEIELFTSAKTAKPIRVDSTLFREALIRATLDPAIRSIDVLPGPTSSQPLQLAIIVRDDGRFVFGVDGDAPTSIVSVDLARFEKPSPPLRTHFLTMQELLSEPRYSNEHLVWSHRHRRVSLGLRLQILQVLTMSGPMKLRELGSTIGALGNLPTRVFAMACADLVELDLTSAPLGPESIVRHRS